MNALLALLELAAKMLAGLAPALALLGAVAVKTLDAADDDDPEDDELVQRAQAGDESALNRLIAKYQRRIYAFVYHILRDADEAEELTQDVFIKLCANLPGFRAESKFSTWLFQIAKNLSLNRIKYLKRRRYYTQTSLDESDEPGGERSLELPAEGKDAAAQIEDSETNRLLHKKIDELGDDVRRPLVMRDIEGMRYDEIAKAMNLAEGTVKSRIHKARTELRESLGEYFEGESEGEPPAPADHHDSP